MINVVIGTMFGDEGKGAVTNALSSFESVTVRFNGGQQAGHTVIERGIKHTFSNFGSGALKRAPTFFSKHCTFYPESAIVEKKILDFHSANTTIFLDPFAKLTLPHDVLANKNSMKGNESVGLGVGKTMERNLKFFKIHAYDILHKEVLREKIKNVENFYYKGLQINFDFEAFYDKILEMGYRIEPWEQFYINNEDRDFVFEGAQGILLDMDHGFFPHVTYSNTTSYNLKDLLTDVVDNHEIVINYVTRCYQTRHGDGWMSNENVVNLINNEGEINVFNKYQGKFRIGEFDPELLSYALNIDRNVLTDINLMIFERNLWITCLDQRPDFDIKKYKFDVNKVIPFKGA